MLLLNAARSFAEPVDVPLPRWNIEVECTINSTKQHPYVDVTAQEIYDLCVRDERKAYKWLKDHWSDMPNAEWCKNGLKDTQTNHQYGIVATACGLINGVDWYSLPDVEPSR